MDAVQFVKDLFMLKFLPQLDSDAGLGLLFILGLLTSFHCVAMCGGILLSQTSVKETAASGEQTDKKRLWFKPSLLYNSGRIAAYTLVGGIVGGIGQVVSMTGIWKGLIPLIGGLLMIIMGINLLGVFPGLRRLNIRMPYFAARKIRSGSSRSPLYIGLLTGLMPCGPLQIVQLYALGTKSAAQGALSMFVFSLGTVPLLFGLGALNTVMNKKYANRMVKVSALFVIFLGIVMAGRGLVLSGIQVPMSSASAVVLSTNTGIAELSGNVQKVVTSIEADSYPPIIVQKGVPVRWTINANENTLNDCNNAITIPKFNIEKSLSAGENLVEFTPKEEGDIVYTCWMGMIKSKITVVGDLKAAAGGKSHE